jgi:tRNA threonylcarbamoyladenosine biosynthesis protein TsaE
MQIHFTLSNIQQAVQQVWAHGKDYLVWAFHGEMGAGKTTFIHALCNHLGVTSVVGSPTYSIINQYSSSDGGTICHMDWYRMKDEEEALQAGVEDALYSGDQCFIEWPERAAGLLPTDTLHITISIISPVERTIDIDV